MSQQSCSKPQVDRVRLASYLTVGVAGAMMATAHSEAAVVMIDLNNVGGNDITGVNGGVASGQLLTVLDWLGVGTGRLRIYNANYGWFGLDGGNGLEFAVVGTFADPRNFAYTSSIDASATWTAVNDSTVFRRPGVSDSPDFGPNSFMGFRFGSAGNYNYGYLEVTWTGATNTFQILSGAYESTANTAILAGATAAVPVPAASLLALMALGGNSFRRNRARAA